jgi:radical SAM enzyme (TIGR01210 family)
MTNPAIAKFLHDRGVAAPPPDRPIETYAKFWERTVRWLAAAEYAPMLVQEHGAEKAREILHLALGQPAYWTDRRLVPQLGREGRYGFILLPGGCRWALEKDKGGQCAFCEFQEIVDAVAGDLPFSPAEFMALFDAGYATMTDSDMLNVFTAGSFLNPGEIPQEAQVEMAYAVARSTHTSILRVESRVQYMTKETIGPLASLLNAFGKTLDIAIGFETQDDYLRNKLLRKGMGRAGFTQAIKTAKALGARVSVYVMLMPLDIDMAEGYAVRECIESIRFAFACGADEVLLQARYSHYDHVKCPKLWSILEVLRETAHLGPVMLGKWEAELPEPKVWPVNCESCTPSVMAVLGRWREGLDPAVLDDDALPTCGCKADWQQLLADTAPPAEVLTGKNRLPVVP